MSILLAKPEAFVVFLHVFDPSLIVQGYKVSLIQRHPGVQVLLYIPRKNRLLLSKDLLILQFLELIQTDLIKSLLFGHLLCLRLLPQH